VAELRAQTDIREGAIKDEEAAREAFGRELGVVRPSSLLVVCFHVG